MASHVRVTQLHAWCLYRADNGPVGSVQRAQESELHIVGGLTLSTSKGHILGATLQGFPWKQGLKLKGKSCQRGEYVKL